jgi:hypothetical protein
MSPPTVESPVSAVAPFDDDAWEDLLNYIEEKRVIPIVGPELAVVQTDAGPENLYAWLARSLAARLGMAATGRNGSLTLNEGIVGHLANRGRRENLYTRIRTIMREATFAPSPALLKLAEITDFDLYVSTTFDSLLEDAINRVRFSGAKNTDVAAYTPSELVDLPSVRSALPRPLVYHLLGRLSASPTYVISDEDVLEFVCALQTAHYMPERLFAELERNHLLLLGGGFSDWLTRLFLRLAKRRRSPIPATPARPSPTPTPSRNPAWCFSCNR